MLRVAKVRSGGHSYYLDASVPDPKRSSRSFQSDVAIESPGQWMGKTASTLGLHGEVGAESFGMLISGSSPINGTPLSANRSSVKVAGFDLTFSAPKSVSLLHALSDDDVASEVKAGHEAAVAGAMGYVERRAVAVRRQVDGLRTVLPAQGIAAGAFVHRTSRALDPHLHTHVVLANAGMAAVGHGGVESPGGPWSALDGRGIYAHRPAVDALYHAQLRHELTARLGVQWGPLNRGRADLAGVDIEVRQAFSVRSAEIAAHLEQRAMGGHRATEMAAVITRAPKSLDISADDLQPWWQARARAAGFGPLQIEGVLGRSPTRTHEVSVGGLPLALHSGGLGHKEVDQVVAQAVDRARGEVAADLHGQSLLRDSLGVTRRQVVRAWACALPDGAPVQMVEQASERLLGLDSSDRIAGVITESPGVAEPRHALSELGLARSDRASMRRTAELLERSRREAQARVRSGLGRGLESGIVRETDLGIGFG